MGNLKWSIGILVSSTPLQWPSFHGSAPVLTAEDVRDVSAAFIADPFLLFRDGCWHMFFEVMNAQTGKGEIGYASSADSISWSYGQIVLRDDFHFSFPSLFEANNEVFMVPESRADNSIRLYRCMRFPDDWKCERILMRGDFADPSLFHYDGHVWLLAHRGLDESCLFYSRDLDSTWVRHPESPLWAGNQSYSRPAGRIFQHGGVMFRPVQDGVQGYGRCVRLMEIHKLSRGNYRERETEQSPILVPARKGWNADAVHHLDAHQLADGSWLAAIDGAAITSGLR